MKEIDVIYEAVGRDLRKLKNCIPKEKVSVYERALRGVDILYREINNVAVAPDTKCTCDGEVSNNDIYCPVHGQSCYNLDI